MFVRGEHLRVLVVVLAWLESVLCTLYCVLDTVVSTTVGCSCCKFFLITVRRSGKCFYTKDNTKVFRIYTRLAIWYLECRNKTYRERFTSPLATRTAGRK